MNIFRYILTVIVASALGACSDADLPVTAPGSDPDIEVTEDAVILRASLNVPEMGEASTRAFGENASLDNLHLYLVEFVDNGSPLLNTFSALYEAEQERVEGDEVIFRLTLNKTEAPRILHLIALPESETITVPFGIEGSVMPSLKTAGGTEAYWRRLSFPNGYCTEVSGGLYQPDPELKRKLTRVPLVRNFACVTVTNRAPGFVLEGFEIINNPRQGTIVPWDAADTEFPEFLDNTGAPRAYHDISSGYSGITPSNTALDNQIAGAGPSVGSTAPKYMYERPFSSINHTYVMIRGSRGGKSYYYKLDLGKNDDMGVFRYYALLRNFRYNIVLNSVEANGYESIADAAQGTVYNNFSFDVELNSMLNMSDGKEIVYVNFTTAVLTSPEEEQLQFKYRYRNLTGSGPTYNNGDANFVDLVPGPVIKSVSYGTADDSEGWRTVTITVNPASVETQMQQFILVKPSGLGRTVNLILHRKWDFLNLREYAGQLTNWSSTTGGLSVAGSGKGEHLTVFFDLPDNLSEAMFPLVFTLESNRQNVENDPVGTMVVTSGASYWDPTQTRIKYEKTVTWTQYNLEMAGGTNPEAGTVIRNPDGTVTHRVHCRLRTINSLDELGMQETHTQIVITNDNYNPGFVNFTRSK